MYWSRTSTSYGRASATSGWDHAKLMSGMASNVAVVVTTDNDLLYCTDLCRVVSPGWSASRLITGLNRDTFLEVKHDGDLVRWSRDGAGWASAGVGTNWGNARLLG